MNKFDFNRFTKVVVRDFHSAYNLFGLGLLILALAPAIVWLLGLSFGNEETSPVFRNGLIEFVVILAAAISSLRIYNSCNLRGRGNYFAMLPATLGEKFLSMMLYCFIICPLVVYVGAFTVDTLLTLLPFGPYKEYVWQLPDWYVEIRNTTMQSGFVGFLSVAVSVILCSSIFMFTNTIFQKNKFLKTILSIMAIFFVLAVVLVPLFMHIGFDPDLVDQLSAMFDDMEKDQVMKLAYWIKQIFGILFTALFTWLTYRRLRKMQY